MFFKISWKNVFYNIFFSKTNLDLLPLKRVGYYEFVSKENKKTEIFRLFFRSFCFLDFCHKNQSSYLSRLGTNSNLLLRCASGLSELSLIQNYESLLIKKQNMINQVLENIFSAGENELVL